MDETPQDQTEPQGDASPGQDEQNKEFDPEQVENDPAYNPDDPGLKGLKGG